VRERERESTVHSNTCPFYKELEPEKPRGLKKNEFLSR